MTTHTDLLVVGAGPAGLSATLTFARLGRPAIMYDSQTYRNAASRVSHTIPAFDGENPAQWRHKALDQMSAYPWVETRDGKIVDLKRLDNDERGTRFEASAAGGKKVIARKVILATGIKDNLAAIPGLQDIWGGRAIHCIYCHGTETRDNPLAFLLATGPASMFNSKIVETALKLWPSLGHPALYFLTNGLDIDLPAELDKTGLKEFLPAIRKHNYSVITDKLSSVEQTPNGLLVHFESDRTMLSLGHIAVLPESWSPNADAAPWLTKDLLGAELAPTGTIAMPDAEKVKAAPPFGPRMGDDPTTATPGLFWAGNVGSLMANVNISVAQGQIAAAVAGDQLGAEDLKVFA